MFIPKVLHNMSLWTVGSTLQNSNDDSMKMGKKDFKRVSYYNNVYYMFLYMYIACLRTCLLHVYYMFTCLSRVYYVFLC